MGTARRYGAALGMIAFLFVAAAGIYQRSPLEWVLLRALVALIMFTVIGFVAGLIGTRLVEEVADKKLAEKVVAEGERLRAENEERRKQQKAEEEEAVEATPASGTPADPNE